MVVGAQKSSVSPGIIQPHKVLKRRYFDASPQKQPGFSADPNLVFVDGALELVTKTPDQGVTVPIFAPHIRGNRVIVGKIHVVGYGEIVVKHLISQPYFYVHGQGIGCLDKFQTRPYILDVKTCR